jgi:hypothetical protein
VLTRPSRFGETGYYGADPAMFAQLKSVIEGGFDPVDLGRVVLEAVRADRFWVLPYPEFVPTIEKNTAEVIEALRSYEDDPDYARRLRLRAEGHGPMPGAS